jgi:hypothetical protein
VSTTRPYRRNYKMMGVENLRRAIAELKGSYGEAYDKVIDNDGDLDHELARAQEALRQKGEST